MGDGQGNGLTHPSLGESHSKSYPYPFQESMLINEEVLRERRP